LLREIRHEAGAGDMAYVQGAYTRTVTLAEANQLFTDYGTFLEVWKRQPEGTWKVAFFASHSTLPASKWMEVEGLGG
jgi:ketosteroid isomerase-like protein